LRLHAAVELGEEVVGEERGDGCALGDAAAEFVEAAAVPIPGVDPLFEEGQGGAGIGIGEEAVEEDAMADAFEESVDVGGYGEEAAAVAPLGGAGDGAVDAAARAVGVAGGEELGLEGFARCGRGRWG
jgi:hypothetical protein